MREEVEKRKMGHLKVTKIKVGVVVYVAQLRDRNLLWGQQRETGR